LALVKRELYEASVRNKAIEMKNMNPVKRSHGVKTIKYRVLLLECLKMFKLQALLLPCFHIPIRTTLSTKG